MIVKQIKAFDQSKGGNTPGYCLRNVRQGYGILPWYPSAISAWKGTQQHIGPIPGGVDVPVFFSYREDGHIGVQLANGKFWSDGKVYDNVKAYTDRYEPVYLGWGESVNRQRVLELREEDILDKKTVENMYVIATNKFPTQANYDYWIGRPAKELAEAFRKGKTNEGMRFRADNKDAGYPALLEENKRLKEIAGEFETVNETLYRRK